MKWRRKSAPFQDRENWTVFLTFLSHFPKIRFVFDYVGGEDNAGENLRSTA